MKLSLIIISLVLSNLSYGQDFKTTYDAIGKFDHGNDHQYQ